MIAQNIAFVGNCQALALMNIFRQITGEEVRARYVAAYESASADDINFIGEADLLVWQLMDMAPKIGAIKTKGNIVTFPWVTQVYLWPYAGEAHPIHKTISSDYRDYYAAEIGDTFLNRLISKNIPAKEGAKQYYEFDVLGASRLDRRYELVLEMQAARDAAAGGYEVAELIRSRYRKENLFRTPNHPRRTITQYLAQSLFGRIGLPADQLAKLDDFNYDGLFPAVDLPIHPAIIKHFSLEWITPDDKYEMLREGPHTFVEWAERYMRFDWNLDLADGFNLISRGDILGAVAAFERAVPACPRSAVARAVLADLLTHQDRYSESVELMQQAIQLAPQNMHFHRNLARFTKALENQRTRIS